MHRHDMKAVRQLIDAGSGFPPHWRGEGGDVNVATAEAMQAPPEKLLLKRQQYFVWMLEDILYQAYLRAVEIGAEPAITETNYDDIFTVESPDVSLRDNAAACNCIEHCCHQLRHPPKHHPRQVTYPPSPGSGPGVQVRRCHPRR